MNEVSRYKGGALRGPEGKRRISQVKGGYPVRVRYGRERLLMLSGHRITAAVYAPRRPHSPCETVTRTFRLPLLATDRWAPAATNCLAAACFSRGFCRVLWTRGHRRDHRLRISHHAPVSRTTPRRRAAIGVGVRFRYSSGVHPWTPPGGRASRRRSSRQQKVDVTFPIQPHAKISIDHHQRSALLFVR